MIRNVDALDGLMSLGEPIDLLVTDPPYAFGGEAQEHAMSATVAIALREAAHRMRTGAWAVVFAASSWRSTAYMVEATRGILTPVRIGTWVKPKARSKVRTAGWAWASVNVIVFRKGKATEGKPSSELDWIEEAPLMQGRRAELPMRVAYWAVAPFADRGGLAVDPFAGTGRLLEAASAHGMRTIGFDKDEAVAHDFQPHFHGRPDDAVCVEEHIA
jgi:16S rRNA G966 N2-methylase RsmD